MTSRLNEAIRKIRFAFKGDSHNHKIFAAAVIVGVATVVVKLASLVKELIVASTYGRGDALDAFLIAFLVPAFAINVIGGSFNAALIPTFMDVREKQGKEAAQRLFSNAVLLSSVLLIGVSIVLALLAPFLIRFLGSGFSAEKLALTERLFFILLPIMLINGLATTWGAVLNAGERFAWVSLASISVPLVIVAALLGGGTTWGIYALAIGTVAGFTLEAGMIAWGLRRHGLSVAPRWSGMDDDLKVVMNQYFPMVAGAALMASTFLVDNAMAAMLESGSVSALSYGNRIVAVITAIGATAIGTAALPYFSKMISNREWGAVSSTLKTYLRLIFLTTVPLTLVLVYFSEELVRLLFERGAFGKADTHLVGQVQRFFLLQVPFYIACIFIVRLISALKANHILMWGTVISVIVNIAMNYLFMAYLGVAGIALSTSIVYLISFIYLFVMVHRKIKQEERRL